MRVLGGIVLLGLLCVAVGEAWGRRAGLFLLAVLLVLAGLLWSIAQLV